MGREIRRVPKGWEHPKNERGDYRPLYDCDFETKAQEWLKECAEWEAGTHPDKPGHECYYWQWAGDPPNEDYYRPKWDAEPVCYQIYETVSEGTPTSPVFETLDEMKVWLVSEGYSEYAASEFVKDGWSPSFVFVPGKGVSGAGIHSLDFLRDAG